MKTKGRNVFIVGAGFSAPARIPIQNRIWEEITKSQTEDILSFDPEPESFKFMHSYIKVGLYLLQNYTNYSCEEMYTTLYSIEKEIQLNVNFVDGDYIKKSDIFKRTQILREQVRENLQKAKLHISLEDVFTSFDKSYQSKEFLHHYSFFQANDIKESIMRLFVYYFSRCIEKHSFLSEEYLNFTKYIKSLYNATIISTNWDVLIEEYFTRQKINYSLCLNEPYFVNDIHGEYPQKNNAINLIKLHGSINWYKCLECGTLNIFSTNNCAKFLFEDNAAEKCYQCKESLKEGTLLQSEFITPTMIKSINSQLYNNLWAAAQRDLRKAEKVTFIGYSLPIADFELRYMLQRCIPSNVEIDVILHNSDDPQKVTPEHVRELLPESRYRDLFVKNKINFYYDGFAEYFEKLVVK